MPDSMTSDETRPVDKMQIEIRSLRPGEDTTAFRTLNEEWITRYFTLEEADRETLCHPETKILSKGGCIFMVHAAEEAVGCVALIPLGEGVYELSKMAVSPRMRGLGIGRRLLEHTIAEARRMGAKSLFWAAVRSCKMRFICTSQSAFVTCRRSESRLCPMPGRMFSWRCPSKQPRIQLCRRIGENRGDLCGNLCSRCPCRPSGSAPLNSSSWGCCRTWRTASR